MKSGTTRAQANRALRQEALRDQLAAKGLVQKVIDDTDKLADLDEQLDSNQVARLRAANDARLALIRKYLPDLKSVEMSGEGGGPMKITWAND
jgi:transcription elongation GreA/GreB family factor